MTNDSVLAVTPFGLPDVRLLAAACAAGAKGVLDLTGAATDDELDRAVRWVDGRFGVRPGDRSPDDLPSEVDLVVVAADRVAGHVAAAAGRTVLAEVTDVTQAWAAVEAGADGLLARGGDRSTFALLEELLAEVPGPVWAWGGMGPHTAAAAIAGGAAGIVLDTALALLAEAAPPPARVAALTRADDAGSYLAADCARRHRDVPGLLRAVRSAVGDALSGGAAATFDDSLLARRLGTRLPVVQGPTTRDGDQPEFAAAVAAAGGLPCVALSLSDGDTSLALLAETARAVGGLPWAAGLLGSAPDEIHTGRLAAITAVRPSVVIIADGQPAQAAALEADGVAAYLHVPSPQLLGRFLEAGARRFVLAGGLDGPWSGVALWQAQIPVLGDWLDRNPGAEVDVLFAGGAHDARSAAMLAAAATPLTVRGAGVGLLMGATYPGADEDDPAAAPHDRLTGIEQLHTEVTAGARAWLADRATPPAEPPAVPVTHCPAPLDVAIVGLAGVFPGAPDTATFWANTVTGTDAVTGVPPHRWDPDRHHTVGSRAGGFLPPIPVDPAAWGIPASSLASIEPVQLLALEVAARALADAGYRPQPDGPGRAFDRSRAAVIFGAESGGELTTALTLRAVLPAYLTETPAALDEQLPRFSADTFPGVLANVITGRIADRMDLGGANYVVDAAGASSLAALDAACRELVTGAADLVLCGGADTHNGLLDYRHFAATGALSPTGRSRPFDRSADGITLGEAVGCLVLKRLDDAVRDGDRVYAVVRGVGSAGDGRARGPAEPRPEGQREALRRAYAQARVSPADVGLVEAHGTGAVEGDRTELAALTGVYTEAGARPGAAALGSVKSQIGHTRCAAGLAALIKTALAVHTGIRPPTGHLTDPHPDWSADHSPFAFDREARPWPAEPGRRAAAVSGFGFGGANFHAVLTGHSGPPARHGLDRWPVELFLFAGPADAARLRDLLDTHPRARLRDLARTAARRFADAGAPATAAVLARSVDELRDRLAGATINDPAPVRPKVAFLFPGQGSQRVGMAAELLVAFPELQELAAGGDDWVRALYPGAAFTAEQTRRQRERLRDTRHAQPALGLAGLAAYRFLELVGVDADLAGGHSYGELVALVAAGTLRAAELPALSRHRADFILAAARDEPSTMVAVAGTPAEVTEVITGIPGVVLANWNSPRQCVVAGHTDAVGQAAVAARERGLTVTELDVACAFHSPVVAGAGPAFERAVARLRPRPPRIPVWSNRTAGRYPDQPELIAAELGAQLGAPVRFAEQIEAMYAAGARLFVECGPGTTLSGMVAATLGDRPHRTVHFEQSGGGLAGALGAVAGLALAGVPVHLDRLFRGRDAVDLTGTEPTPAPLWTADGHAVRDADGEFLPGGVGAARPVAPAPGRGGDDLIDEYLRTTREFVAAQRDVMLAYLGAEAGLVPELSVVAGTPEPVSPVPSPVSSPVPSSGKEIDLLDRPAAARVARHAAASVYTSAAAAAHAAVHAAAVAPLRFIGDWTPEPAQPTVGLTGRRVAISGAGTGVGAALEQALRTRHAVPAGPDEPADDIVLLDALAAPADDSLHLPALFERLRAAAGTGAGVLAAAVDDDPGIAGLTGFFRALQRERPDTVNRLVRVHRDAPPETVAATLLAELGDRRPEPVTRHAGARLIATVTATPLDAADPELDPDAVLLLIGGARGIAAEVARTCAARGSRRIVLAGRTPAGGEPEDAELAAAPDLVAVRKVLARRDPDAVDQRARAVLARREVAATIAGLGALGCVADYQPVDVTDAGAVHALVKTVQATYGRLDGVIFAAGVVEEGLLADKSEASFRRVFGAKVDGARNLLAALDALPAGPSFVTLFGSIAAVRGSRGRSDLAAADEALAELGRQWAVRSGRRCLTVHWGPWADDRVRPARHARPAGQLIDPAAGGAALLRELASGDPARTDVIYAAPGWGFLPEAE